MFSGGSPCREEIVKLAESLGMIYYNMYGLSETLGWAFSSTEDGAHEWMMPITDVRPVVSEKGELGIHVPYHMEGYYKRPEDTREVLDGDVIWTGDAVVVDELGRIRILGRVRDMIVLENGEKVNAGDKDADLMQLPHVKEAAVIGVNGALIALIVPEDPAYWEEITAALYSRNPLVFSMAICMSASPIHSSHAFTN